jgi:hypothetical protein
MTRNVLRIGNALAVSVALGSGVLAVFSKPADAWAQEGTIKCYAETCVNNTCVRTQIECPAIIRPVRPG